eukprot:Blabericola_migrator_1__823@NODE_1201_length_5128_cov_115_219917_g813_i0_p1_GENE_NODE_1201_length_5128_cov_115_219917_g813_i0NODE_1201_length_5128_cov_115_219917_g813_i0_p1_ORF_typecomplete_len1058_score231_43P16Arc/PF04699_14/4_4e02P16Arc/PF04699_14/0_74Prot_ATP_ID_OB/PF16450_5/12Prot_ATP_ID_OB/PF16450_5/31NPV_P10/PF05531_12/3_5e02NPV_P10/PF05531_12/27NPV_P10/PF05531_12/1_4e03_NODE_1201_length_5128_cov_115_219917_g813_i01543327
MPPYNLIVPSPSTSKAKAVFIGLLCTLPGSLPDSGSVTEICDKSKPNKRTESLHTHSEKALNEMLDNTPGNIFLFKKTSKEEATEIRTRAMETSSSIAAGIQELEARNINYAISVRRKMEYGTGLKKGTPLCRPTPETQAILDDIEKVCPKQVAAVKKVLTTVEDLAELLPGSITVPFKYFLDEVSAVLSFLKRTYAPTELLSAAVPVAFAKYKTKYWNAVMELAGEEAAKDLQACVDVLLDSQQIDSYMKFVKKFRRMPSDPSSEKFDVAFGILSKVDEGMTSAFRDLIVCLHETVERQVDSLGNALQVNREEMKDEEIKSQIDQLDICTGNYLKCFHSIAQELARGGDVSGSKKKVQLQAVMRDRITNVHLTSWPCLETCLERLCDPSVVEVIKSKVQTLTKQLFDEHSGSVIDSVYMSRLWSLATSFMGTRDISIDDHKTMSPMLIDLLKIVKQVASSDPEESPNVPDKIKPGDRVAMCGVLGYVSKPKAAALYTFLNRLEELLKLVEFEAFASSEALALIEKLLNVDYHIIKAIEDEGHFLDVHGNLDVEECDEIMTSTFNNYFNECWNAVTAVLGGGEKAEAIRNFEKMAADILNWKDPQHKLDSRRSSIMKAVQELSNINVAWYLLGMFQFLQGVSSESWRWYKYTQDMWDNGFCLKFRPGTNLMHYSLTREGDGMVCLPAPTPFNQLQRLDLATEQVLGSDDTVHRIQANCYDDDLAQWAYNTFAGRANTDDLDYSQYGDAHRDPYRGYKLLRRVEERGIKTSCQQQFKSQWYDATNQIIKSLCNEALAQDNAKYNVSEEAKPRARLLGDEYEFQLVTGFQGLDFKSDVEQSNYQGFIMCLDTALPENDEVMDKALNTVSYLDKIVAQRRCRWRTHNGRERDVNIFYSTLNVERDGKIYIHNSDHQGYIDRCWPGPLEKTEALASGDADDVSEGNRVMSGKEIAEMIAEEGLNQVKGRGYETHRANWTAERAGLRSEFESRYIGNAFNLGEPLERCATEPCEAVNVLTPCVAGVMGTIGSVFAVKKLWNRYKVQRNKQYERVTDEEEGAV